LFCEFSGSLIGEVPEDHSTQSSVFSGEGRFGMGVNVYDSGVN